MSAESREPSAETCATERQGRMGAEEQGRPGHGALRVGLNLER